MPKRIYSLYKVVNKLNQKTYSGYTVQTPPEVRWLKHLSDARCGSEWPLHAAIRKYGCEAFSFEVICQTRRKVWALQLEKQFIKLYHTLTTEWGYNISTGGRGGSPATANRRDKIASRSKELWQKPTYRDRLLNSLLKPECLAKRSEAMISKWQDFDYQVAQSAGVKAAWQREEYRAAQNAASLHKFTANVRCRLSQATTTWIAEHPDEREIINQKIGESQAKNWQLTNPAGNQLEVRNLKRFCRQQGLHYSGMCAVANGQQRHHKGWTCRKL